MWRLSWKGVLAHKVRLVLTGMAIVLGVAFIVGSFVFTDRMSAAFDELFEGSTEGVDLYVQEAGTLGFTVGRIPEEVLDDIRAVEGVALAVPTVQGFAQMIDKEGKPIGGSGPPTFGSSVDADDFDVSLGRGGHRCVHRQIQRLRGGRHDRGDLCDRGRGVHHRRHDRLR
jgi:putative ABC transport system permease protein